MTMALPPYSDRLLGYVDILGWSKIVRDETRAAEVPMAMLEVQAEKDTWEIANALVRADYAVQMSEFSDSRTAPRPSRTRSGRPASRSTCSPRSG
jgi:hypothetical protein